MDFGQGGAGGSSLIMTKVEAREGRGGTFPSTVPVGLEVSSSNGKGVRGGNIREAMEGRDELPGEFIDFWGANKHAIQNGMSSRGGAIHTNTVK